MAQRRTPSGQGPARKPGSAGRAVPGRGVPGRGATGRAMAGAAGPPGVDRPAAPRASEPGRSATRPAGARRAAMTGAAKRTVAAEPRRLTGRAAVFGLALVGLLLAYAYPIRVYLSQEAEIARLRAEQTTQRDRIGTLAEQRAKWEDPEYVKAQARKRFHLVERGDRTYIVIFDPQGAARDAGVPPGPAADQTPWYGKLWSSIGEANQP